tara:strand:+ start:4628 stop:4825 length:198 start_codon:yes stop_codon:yes gene_type:complete
MIKRITKRGTATVGELIEALQELNPNDEAYIYSEEDSGQEPIGSIETFDGAIYIGSSFALGEDQP